MLRKEGPRPAWPVARRTPQWAILNPFFTTTRTPYLLRQLSGNLRTWKYWDKLKTIEPNRTTWKKHEQIMKQKRQIIEQLSKINEQIWKSSNNYRKIIKQTLENHRTIIKNHWNNIEQTWTNHGCHMDSYCIWIAMPYGYLCHMYSYVIWIAMPYGKLCHMDSCAIWIAMSYG